MPANDFPSSADLPTTKQLNRATLIAAAVAGALLVTVVMPAEYGVDPVGTGRILGLTAMGEAKKEANTEAAFKPTIVEELPTEGAATAQSQKVQITLAPGEGQEVKADMRGGDSFEYQWATGGPEVRFELHGEEKGAAADAYTSYEKGTSAGASGKFTAPFDGTHGWFWRNRTDGPVTITVVAKGTFRSFAAKPKS